MTDGYATQLAGRAQDLGDGRFGVLVEHGGSTYYVEHAVSADGLSAKVWNEREDALVAERTMDWNEAVGRMFSSWQQSNDIDNQ